MRNAVSIEAGAEAPNGKAPALVDLGTPRDARMVDATGLTVPEGARTPLARQCALRILANRT